MSFNAQPGLSLGQKAGCAIYVLFGGLISAFFMLNAALGDCASEGECLSETTRAAMFYGTPLLTIAGGMLLIRYFMRDKN